MSLRDIFRNLRRDRDGAMVIETALVAPVLVLMSLGAYQVSGVIARQSELQSAASEGAAIALASAPDTSAKRTVLKNVMVASTGLSASQVTVTQAYRCDTDTAYVVSLHSCHDGDFASHFVRIHLSDTYTPTWTRFGIGSPINYNVTRYVMYKQSEVHL